MTPLADTDTAARVVFYVTLAAWVVLEWRTRLRSALDKTGTRADQGSLVVVVISVGIGVVGAFQLAEHVPGADITQLRPLTFGLGMLFMWAGIALRQWAIVLLGSYFTVDVRVRSGQAVIDRGPYRWVRHPSYTGMTMTFLGIGLALGNWLALLVVLVVPLAGLVVRIRVEERTLLAGLGEPYRRYAAGRARLVPGVW